MLPRTGPGDDAGAAARAAEHEPAGGSTRAPLVGVRDLTCRFGGLVALDGVSFDVGAGSIHGIIGPNGAGKTTLFNCVSGLYRPATGSIRFDGRELVGRKPHRIAALGIGRTFQNLELFGRATTLDNLLLGRHLHMRTGIFGGAAMLHRRSRVAREEVEHREHVERIIDLLELQAVRDMPVLALPYGTRKRVELGRALALEPRLLLLDEPAAGLTSEERQDLMFWIQDIRSEFRVTILMIEHHIQMVMGLSDRVLVLNFGRVIAEGEPDRVARDPEVVKAYLGEEAADATVA